MRNFVVSLLTFATVFFSAQSFAAKSPRVVCEPYLVNTWTPNTELPAFQKLKLMWALKRINPDLVDQKISYKIGASEQKKFDLFVSAIPKYLKRQNLDPKEGRYELRSTITKGD